MLSLRATCGPTGWARSLHCTLRRVVCAGSHTAWSPTPCGGPLQGRAMETTAMRSAVASADPAGPGPDSPTHPLGKTDPPPPTPPPKASAQVLIVDDNPPPRESA